MLSVVQIYAATEVMWIINDTIYLLSDQNSVPRATWQSCHALWRLIRNNFRLGIGSLRYLENIWSLLIIVLLIEFGALGRGNVRRILSLTLASICWLKCTIYVLLLLNLSRLIRTHINQAAKLVVFRLLLALLDSDLTVHRSGRSSSHDEGIIYVVAMRLERGFQTLGRVHWTEHVIFRVCCGVARMAFDRPHMNHVSSNADWPRILIFVTGLLIVEILLDIWGLYDGNFLARIINTWFSLIHRIWTRHRLSCLIFIELLLLLLHLYLGLNLKLLCRHLRNFVLSSCRLILITGIRIVFSNLGVYLGLAYKWSCLVEHIIVRIIDIILRLLSLKIIWRDFHSNFYFFAPIIFSGSTLCCTNTEIDSLRFRLVLISYLILWSLIVEDRAFS